jgi:hypothetical protein
MPDDAIHLNGINALTGEYLVPPMSFDDAGRCAGGAPPPPPERTGWLRRLAKRFGSILGLPADVDPHDLAQTGWGVVFAQDTPPEVRDALKPLTDRRGEQAKHLFRVLDYKPGEAREGWLARFKAHGSDVNPTAVPYYLLLVGNPEQIPFEFQYLLDIDYAVGRVAFDTPGEYARYAEAVVRHETGTSSAAREVFYWGTRHPMDRATQLSADKLIGPLSGGESPVAQKYGYASRCELAAGATKAKLLDALHSASPPAVLFTACHGLGGWPKGDPRQRAANGALLCQDWPGFGAVEPRHYLAAADLEPAAKLDGTVAVVFACYGAGTPRYDAFLTNPAGGPVEIAAAPFVAALPQRLLSHPSGPALAVVGHVERAWGYSLEAKGAGAQIQPFRNLLARLLKGEPVGCATVDFSQRFVTYSADLLSRLDPSSPGAKRAADPELVRAWVERNDAQSYVVLGDPAARLRVC